MEAEQQQQGNGTDQPSELQSTTLEENSPPKPPPRVASQMSTASKMIPLTPVPTEALEKPVRPTWFRIAYVAVGIAITGILTTVLGAILLILRFIRFQTGSEGRHHYYYFGRKVPKQLGLYILGIGITTTFFGWLVYHASLIRIDRYINALQDYNSKKKREGREQAPQWTEEDPLMEQEEDDYYEKKRKAM